MPARLLGGICHQAYFFTRTCSSVRLQKIRSIMRSTAAQWKWQVSRNSYDDRTISCTQLCSQDAHSHLLFCIEFWFFVLSCILVLSKTYFQKQILNFWRRGVGAGQIYFFMIYRFSRSGGYPIQSSNTRGHCYFRFEGSSRAVGFCPSQLCSVAVNLSAAPCRPTCSGSSAALAYL